MQQHIIRLKEGRKRSQKVAKKINDKLQAYYSCFFREILKGVVNFMILALKIFENLVNILKWRSNCCIAINRYIK